MSRKDRAPIHLSLKDRVRYAIPTLANVVNALTAVAIAGSIAFHHGNISSDTASIPPKPPIAGSPRADNITPPPFARNTQEQKQFNESLLQNEVKRLGIQPSETEGPRWQKGYNKTSEKLPINDETLQVALQRTQTAMDLMSESDNPHLKDAILYLNDVYKEGGLEHGITVFNNTTDAIVTHPTLKDGKLVMVINYSADTILNDSSAITLAFQIAHEVEHVREIRDFYNSLPEQLTPQEKLLLLEERTNNYSLLIDSEANGYAADAKAFIYAYGLGYRSIDATQFDRAIHYIRSGSNPKSISWKKVIENFIREDLHEQIQINKKAVKAEAQKLGMQTDIDEANMWQHAYPMSNTRLPLNEITFQEGQHRLGIIINNMRKSKNKVLRNAAEILERVRTKELGIFTFFPRLDVQGHIAMGVSVETNPQKNKVDIDVGVSLDAILNEIDPTTMAIGAAHEAFHVFRIDEYLNSLPNTLTPQQKVEAVKKWLRDNNAQEEALAYGVQSEAFIIQVALGLDVDNEQQEVAAAYSRLGKTSTSLVWKEYIRRILLAGRN